MEQIKTNETTNKEEAKKIGFVERIKSGCEKHPKTVKFVKRVAFGVAVGTAIVLGRKYIRDNGAEIMAKIGSGDDAAEPNVDANTEAK